jgi:hypothetical protein
LEYIILGEKDLGPGALDHDNTEATKSAGPKGSSERKRQFVSEEHIDRLFFVNDIG